MQTVNINTLTANLIQDMASVKEALEKLSALPHKSSLTLFIVDSSQKILGTLTDGDIRRGLLAGKNITDNVKYFMNSQFKYLKKGNFQQNEIEVFRKLDIHLLPILDQEGKLYKLLDLSKTKAILPLDVLIMAGGEGQRLKPLTNNTPKPLLPVNGKPIISYNIDNLTSYGIENIFISVKYLANKIKEYFNQNQNEAQISYIDEAMPLGTLGALALLENYEHHTILVMNSDLLTNIDIEDFYKEFVDKKADMAVATIPYKVTVPYAVLETDHEKVLSFKEKPTFTYQSSAGIYLIKREIADLIPKNTFYNATDLMEEVIKLGKKLIYYPLFCYWLDIGRPEDYAKAQEDIKHIKF